jgi:hypothetical protein
MTQLTDDQLGEALGAMLRQRDPHDIPASLQQRLVDVRRAPWSRWSSASLRGTARSFAQLGLGVGTAAAITAVGLLLLPLLASRPVGPGGVGGSPFPTGPTTLERPGALFQPSGFGVDPVQFAWLLGGVLIGLVPIVATVLKRRRGRVPGLVRALTGRRAMVAGFLAAGISIASYSGLSEPMGTGSMGSSSSPFTVALVGDTAYETFWPGRQFTLASSIRNTGPVPILVEGIALLEVQPSDALKPIGLVEYEPQLDGSHRPLEPFWLAPGEEAWVGVAVRFPPCSELSLPERPSVTPEPTLGPGATPASSIPLDRSYVSYDQVPISYRLLGVPRSGFIRFTSRFAVPSPVDCPGG